MKKIKVTRPTIRLDVEFNEQLKKVINKKGTSFQDLTRELLEKWYEDNKGCLDG